MHILLAGSYVFCLIVEFVRRNYGFEGEDLPEIKRIEALFEQQTRGSTLI